MTDTAMAGAPMIRWASRKASAIACIPLLLCMGAAQAREDVQARSPQRRDVLIDALATAPWPISPARLRELGLVAPFHLEKDAGLRIYRAQPMRTADGYIVEDVEYRVLPGNEDDIRALFVTFAAAPCFPLQRLSKRYPLERFIYPPAHGPVPAELDHDQHHWLKSGALTSVISSQRDAPHCVVRLKR